MWLWDFQKRDSTLGHTKRLCAPGPKGKEQWPHRKQSKTYFLVLEGLLQRKGVAVAHAGRGALAAAVLSSTPWYEPSWSLPLVPPQGLYTPWQVSSVQSLSRVWLFVTPWIAAHQASLSITNSQTLLKLMSIRSVMPSSHLILYRPLLLLPPIPCSIRIFSNESTLRMKWPKYWSFSFSISPSSEHPELISFRMNWLHLLAVQGTLKSLLQHHSSKASILRCSAFFTVQLSHPYMTTGKTIALTRRTFVGKDCFWICCLGWS